MLWIALVRLLYMMRWHQARPRLLACFLTSAQISKSLITINGRHYIWRLLSAKIDIIEVLVGAGCDIDATDADGYTALHIAVIAYYRRTEIVETLLRHNPDIKVQNSEGLMKI